MGFADAVDDEMKRLRLVRQVAEGVLQPDLDAVLAFRFKDGQKEAAYWGELAEEYLARIQRLVENDEAAG
jgi:hypothetical protein